MKSLYCLKFIIVIIVCVQANFVLKAQGFHLVKDINSSQDASPAGTFPTPDSNPHFVVLNGISYFFAEDGLHGRELWRSDGTAAGTYMVKDIYPGTISSNPAYLVVSGNKLFFSATDGSGFGLWMSDGTDGGTNIVPGSPAYASSLTDVAGILYFFDNPGNLWKSDGTAMGTVVIATLTNGFPYGDNLVNLNGILISLVYDFTYGIELFRTDGTPAGTYMLKDINPFGDSNPLQLTVVNGILYFSANDGSGRKLWQSDGQTSGTIPAINNNDIIINEGFSVTIGNKIYFSANSNTTGSELYKYDADAPAVTLVKDIAAGSDSSNPQNIINVNGTLFFSAKGTDGNTGLWKSDGTDAGTQPVKNFITGAPNILSNFYNANGELYFNYSNSVYGGEIWKSDATDAGTQMVKDIYAGPGSSNPVSFTFLNPLILFSANDGTTGNELWKSDGSMPGTLLLKDINQSVTSSSEPMNLVSFGNNLFFSASENEHGSELWKSDGTDPGTTLYTDIIAGPIGGSAINITGQKNNLYFFSLTDTLRLWKTNGTNGISTLIKTFAGSSVYAYNPFGARASENLLYFFISDTNIQSLELWRSDGTAAGTFLLKNDLSPVTMGGSTVAVTGDNIFIGNLTDTSAALWKSDGTIAGTVLVKNFQRGAFYEIAYLYAYNGNVFFSADDGSGTRLWKSDGTETGTVIVKDLFRPGLAGYAESNGFLFFDADDGTSRQLWKTDGTPGGTTKVKQIGPYDSSPQNLTDLNGILYFTANDIDYSVDTGHGSELYKTDGTEAGTQLVKDITPGTASTNFPFNGALVNGNGELYFTIYDPSYTNLSLWKSNGTPGGTAAVDDMGLDGVTRVTNLTSVGTQLFFSGSSYKSGSELYVGNVFALPVTLVRFYGEVQGKQNLLHWTTATEQNNKGFEVQRSIDGNNFTRIGFTNTKTINGTGNTNLNYDFIDAGYSSPINYYRLKQIDKDDKFSYSNIVVLKNNTMVVPGLISLYPNPVKDLLNIKIASPGASKIILVITDINGQSLIKKVSNSGGSESIIQVDVSVLSAGTYYLKLICTIGCENIVTKFVKQ
ncbi:MAG: ELWxxDGT repeat protein [Ginsengibacter sp.]